MSSSNSTQNSWRVRVLEIVIVLLFFWGGVYAGKAYLNAVRTDRSAIVGTELLYGPPAMYAAGYGFYQPDTSASPELRAFLRNEVDTLEMNALPAEIPETPSAVASYHRYLLYAVAVFWCVFGISWSSLELLAALMLGWCAVVVYGLFRLGMGRIISVMLALVFMLSPPILIMLPHLRDFGKAPFLLSTIFLLVYMIKAKPDMSRLRFLLPLLGVLIGVGMGFRQDIIILIPPAILVTCIALYRSDKGAWRQRAGIGVLFLVCLFGIAWPMLGRMEGGAEPYHPLVQGYSMKRMESLGIEPAVYAPLACGQDNYVFSVLYDYYRRVNHEPNAHFEYNSPGIEAAGRQWLLDMGAHFPADIITRGYASVLRSLRYADAYTPWFTQLPPGLHGLESIHLKFATFMHRFGLLLGLVAVLLLGARNMTAGLGLIVFVVYVFGYVGLQCEFRHAFHLSFVPFWVVGFLAANLAKVLRRPADCGMTGKQWRSLTGKALLFILCALVLVVAPLYVLRLYQQYMAKPFIEDIIASTCTRVETRKTTKSGWALFTETERPSIAVATEEPAGKATAIKRMLNEMEEWLRGEEAEPLLWDTHTRYMVAEFDAATLPEWFYIRYTSEGAWNDFSQVVRLPYLGKTQGTVRYFFPVYELYMLDDKVAARNLFVGVGVPEQQAGALQGLYEIEDLSKIHFLMHLITIDSVWPLPLYQKINFRPDPLMYYFAENDPVAIATQAEQAMRMGRTREAIFLYRTALLLSPITSHRLHIARMLMTLDELDAAFDGALDARNMTKAYAQETAQLLFDLGITYKDADNFEKMDAAFNAAEKLLIPLVEKEQGGTAAKLYQHLCFVHGEAVIRHIDASLNRMPPEDIVKSISQAVGNAQELHYLAAECLEKAGAFYAEKKQHRNARLLYETAAQYAPENAFTAIRAAEILAKEGNVTEAREQLTALLQKEPCESAAAALQRILQEYATDEERLEFWDTRAAQDKAPLCVLFYYGCELAHAGRYEQALDVFIQVQKAGYDSAELELRMRIVQRAIEKDVQEETLHEFVMQEHPELTALALQLLLHTAQTLDEQKQFVVAELMAREALNLSPEMEAIWLALGEALTSQGKSEAALEVYVRAFTSASTCKQIALKMDMHFDQTGDLQRRYDTWRTLSKQDPEDEVVQLHCGMACESIGAYEEAREAYSRLVDNKEFAGIANIRLGGVLACLGEVEVGYRKIETAVAADESLKSLAAWVCQNAGQVLSDAEKSEEAILLYQFAAEYAPDNPFPWLKMGEMLQRQGKTDDALTAYRHVIRTDVASPPAMEAARQVDAMLNPDEQVVFWAELVAQIPEALLPSLRYGFSLADTEPETAAAVVKRLMKNYSENAEMQLLQGIVWCGTGKLQEGLALTKQAVETAPYLAPEGSAHLASIAKTASEKGDNETALALFQHAVSLAPENLAYTLMLGETLLAQGENRAAIEEFQKILMKVPESPRSAQLLDDACKKLDTPDVCRDIWQKIVDAHPDAQLPRKYLGE